MRDRPTERQVTFLELFYDLVYVVLMQVAPELGLMYRRAGRILFLSSLITLLLGFTNLATIPLLVLMVLLMLTPVFYGVKTWVEVVGAGASPLA